MTVTFDEVASTLPGRIVDAIEATAPCRQSPKSGLHYWHTAEVEVMQFGVIRPVRVEAFVECLHCRLVLDRDLYEELGL